MVTGRSTSATTRSALASASSSGSSPASEKPCAPATEALPVAIALAPASATALALPTSPALNRINGSPATCSAAKVSNLLAILPPIQWPLLPRPRSPFHQRALIPTTGPIFDESIWAIALRTHRCRVTELHTDPARRLGNRDSPGLPSDARIQEGRRAIPLSAIRQRIAELQAAAVSELLPPWPGRDREHGDRFFWTLYSPERLLERTRLVYEGAIRGYAQVVDLWLQPLSKRLATSVALPSTLTGQLRVGPPEAGYAGGPLLRWWLEPLPMGGTTSVRIDYVPPEEWPTFDADELHQIRDRLHQLRPTARRWIGATMHHQALDIFGRLRQPISRSHGCRRI